MVQLNDFYAKEAERLETSLYDLHNLTSIGAVEIDNYILGRNNDFTNLKELTRILKKYQLSENGQNFTNFPYMPLWQAIRKNSDKEIRYISELALEMKLLNQELESIPINPKNLRELCHFLCDFTGELLNEEYTSGYIRRAA